MRTNLSLLLILVLGVSLACQKSKVKSSSNTGAPTAEEPTNVESSDAVQIDASRINPCNVGAALFLASNPVDGGKLPIEVNYTYRNYEGQKELLVGCKTDETKASFCQITLDYHPAIEETKIPGKEELIKLFVAQENIRLKEGTKAPYRSIRGGFKDQFTIPKEYQGKRLLLGARACTETVAQGAEQCSNVPDVVEVKDSGTGLNLTSQESEDPRYIELSERIYALNLNIAVNRIDRENICGSLVDGAKQLMDSAGLNINTSDYNDKLQGLLSGNALNSSQKSILNFANLLLQSGIGFSSICSAENLDQFEEYLKKMEETHQGQQAVQGSSLHLTSDCDDTSAPTLSVSSPPVNVVSSESTGSTGSTGSTRNTGSTGSSGDSGDSGNSGDSVNSSQSENNNNPPQNENNDSNSTQNIGDSLLDGIFQASSSVSSTNAKLTLGLTKVKIWADGKGDYCLSMAEGGGALTSKVCTERSDDIKIRWDSTDDGYVTIKSKSGRMCMNVLESGVFSAICSGGDNEKFKLISSTDGFALNAKGTNRCVHFTSGNAARLTAAECTKNSSGLSHIKLMQGSNIGSYCLQFPKGGGSVSSDTCEPVTANNVTTGGVDVGVKLVRDEDYIIIKDADGTSCLHMSGVNVFGTSCSSTSDSQKFKLIQASGGFALQGKETTTNCVNFSSDASATVTGAACDHDSDSSTPPDAKFAINIVPAGKAALPGVEFTINPVPDDTDESLAAKCEDLTSEERHGPKHWQCKYDGKRGGQILLGVGISAMILGGITVVGAAVNQNSINKFIAGANSGPNPLQINQARSKGMLFDVDVKSARQSFTLKSPLDTSLRIPPNRPDIEIKTNKGTYKAGQVIPQGEVIESGKNHKGAYTTDTSYSMETKIKKNQLFDPKSNKIYDVDFATGKVAGADFELNPKTRSFMDVGPAKTVGELGDSTPRGGIIAGVAMIGLGAIVTWLGTEGIHGGFGEEIKGPKSDNSMQLTAGDACSRDSYSEFFCAIDEAANKLVTFLLREEELITLRDNALADMDALKQELGID